MKLFCTADLGIAGGASLPSYPGFVQSWHPNMPALDNNTVFYIPDRFDPEWLYPVVDFYGKPGLVFGFFSSLDLKDIPYFGLPISFAWQANKYFANEQFLDSVETEYAFNFIINRKRINRHLVAKLVELFQLTDYTYTASNVERSQNLQFIVDELNSLDPANPLLQIDRSCFLSPVNIETRWIDDGADQTIPTFGQKLHSAHDTTWNSGLNQIFYSSAVSLITETIETEPGSFFTEKTLYALLGLTFPIWIGGINHASEFKNLGFDIFEDVVDHSYESMPTLIERCYWAVAKNLDLLKDKNLCRELRKRNLDRLLDNRNKVFDGRMKLRLNQLIDTLPDDCSPLIREALTRYYPVPL